MAEIFVLVVTQLTPQGRLCCASRIRQIQRKYVNFRERSFWMLCSKIFLFAAKMWVLVWNETSKHFVVHYITDMKLDMLHSFR